MSRGLIGLAAAGILAISGCGQPAPGTAPAATADSTRATTTATSKAGVPSAQQSQTVSAASAAGHLTVTQDAADPSAVWFVRVERANGENVVERPIPAGAAKLTTDLGAGDYRVLAWRRPCTGPCPTTGEAGLGDLERVCGAKLRITAATTTRAALTSTADGDCTLQPQ